MERAEGQVPGKVRHPHSSMVPVGTQAPTRAALGRLLLCPEREGVAGRWPVTVSSTKPKQNPSAADQGAESPPAD